MPFFIKGKPNRDIMSLIVSLYGITFGLFFDKSDQVTKLQHKSGSGSIYFLFAFHS